MSLLVIMQMEVIEKNLEQERQSLKFQVIELERKLETVTQDLATSKSTLAVANADLAALHNNLKELEELREMKEVHKLLHQVLYFWYICNYFMIWLNFHVYFAY